MSAKKTIKDPKDVVCHVFDQGLFFEIAVTLAKTFKKVYYTVPWESAFPKLNLSKIGYGFEDEGVEVVDSLFGPSYDSVDVFVFPDLNHGPLQEHLVKCGKNVWGGRMGECLETSRDGMKAILEKLDMPVGKFEVIKGTESLRAYLRENKNVWVKINRWRGQMETFKSPSYEEVMPRIDQLEYELGPFKYIVDFVVEEDLPDKVELGTDSWVITDDEGKAHFTHNMIAGLEIKDRGCITRFTTFDKLPEELTRFNTRMLPVFAAYGYRGFLSTEVRIGDDMQPFMTDACCRAPSPPNEAYQVQYRNLADIIWYGSQGIVVEPEMEAEWGCLLMIHSSFADKNFQPVMFPEEYRERIKLRNPTKINGNYYCIPQSVGLPEIGAVVGLGDTVDEAIEDALTISKEIKGYYIETITGAVEDAKEQMKEMERLGFDMFK